MVFTHAAAIRGAVLADLVLEYDSPDASSHVDGTLLKLLELCYHFTELWKSYGVFGMILPSISKSRQPCTMARRGNGRALLRSCRLLGEALLFESEPSRVIDDFGRDPRKSFDTIGRIPILTVKG
jgi:hypothetical protein